MNMGNKFLCSSQYKKEKPNRKSLSSVKVKYRLLPVFSGEIDCKRPGTLPSLYLN